MRARVGQETPMVEANLHQFQGPQKLFVNGAALRNHQFVAQGTPSAIAAEKQRLGKQPLERKQRQITQISLRCQSLQRLDPAFRAAANAINGIGDQPQIDTIRIDEAGNLFAYKTAN
jgi:hypothetical protein